MSGVDSRVVTMKFDNAAFEKGASTTMSTLARLKESLNFSGAKAGLGDLQGAANKVDFSNINAQTHGISKAFVAMSTIAITALASVTSKVMELGGGLVKQLSGVSAITAGFSDYNMKIQATQTIMAGTGASIETTTKYLKDLDIYADRTIYSLADMTSNIGKFTNAGVKLPTATKAMIGIANVAARSGANADEAARAMYNLGQAIGQGTVKMMDWKSVELANMGTIEFKQQLIDSALAAGSLTKAADGTVKTLKGTIVTSKNFSTTLSDQWLTSKALVKTLKRYGDENTAIGKKSFAAATQVKTFGMMMETLKAAAGTGWTDTFDILIGNLPEATKMWTDLTNVIGTFIGKSADARNKVLGDWKKLGGRTDAIESIKNVFHALGAVLGPIHDAFRELFPPKTGKDLYNITHAIREFTEKLIPSEKTSDNLRRTFKGLFAILSIGTAIFKGILGYVAGFFGLLSGSGGVGSITGLTGGVGDFLVKLQEWLVTGGAISRFFENIGKFRDTVLAPVIEVIGKIASAFGALVSGGAGLFFSVLTGSMSAIGPVVSGLGGIIQGFFTSIGGFVGTLGSMFNVGPEVAKTVAVVHEVSGALTNTQAIAEDARTSWQKLVDAFKAIGTFLAPVVGFLKEAFGAIKEKLQTFVSGMGIEDSLALVNTGFFIAFYMMLRSFLKNMRGMVKSAKEMFDNVGGVLKQLTSNLKTMQTDVRSNIILKIAIALGVLAAALWVLSKIDKEELKSGLVAVSIMLGLLVGALITLEKTSSFSGAANLAMLSIAMIGLSVAILAMAGAIAILGNMDTDTLIKGMSTVAAILAVVVAASAILSKTGGAAQMLIAAAAIGILAFALTAFAGALKLYASIDPMTLLDGGLKAAAAILVIGLTMRAMPANMLLTAAGLLIVSAALVVLAGALKILGGMSAGEMAKSLIMLGGSLLIIAVGLNAMTGTLPGAAAILVFAGALAVLVPPLIILGNLDWSTILKAIAALALIFLVLGAAGYILAPVVPVIMGLAGAIALMGVGLLMVGAGLLLFSMGLAGLAASGAAGAAVLVAAIISIAELIPLIMQQFGLGLIAFAKVLATAGPALIAAFTTVLASLIQAIINVLPKIGALISKIITVVLKILTDNVPKIITAGVNIIMALLTGFTKNIGKISKAAVDAIIAFMRALATQIPRLVDAGAKLIIKFINGLSTAIDANSAELGAAGGRLAVSIVKGMVTGIGAGIGEVVEAARKLGQAALDKVKGMLHIGSPSKEFHKIGVYVSQGFANGIVGGLKDLEKALAKMTDMLKDAGLSTRALSEANVAELKRLARQYDAIDKRLSAAKKKLADVKKIRDDQAKSIADQFDELPDISKGTSVSAYENKIKKETAAAIKFKQTLDALRKAGMDDITYNKLLAEGVDSQAFADKLLAGGSAGIKELNALNKGLATAAAALGKKAAADLNKAGVDAAQGLVNGLQKKRDAIANQMKKIAKAMVRAIRRELGMKSPSREFMDIGKFATLGLAQGLKAYSGVVDRSAVEVANVALDAIKNTMAGITDTVANDLDANPVIAPVLDLTSLQKEAKRINDLLLAETLTADVSFKQASSISADRETERVATANTPSETPQTLVQLEQNNYSPKALSHVEIYRQTKNQLALAKEALKVK